MSQKYILAKNAPINAPIMVQKCKNAPIMNCSLMHVSRQF